MRLALQARPESLLLRHRARGNMDMDIGINRSVVGIEQEIMPRLTIRNGRKSSFRDLAGRIDNVRVLHGLILARDKDVIAGANPGRRATAVCAGASVIR
jgi:hypothetical protein